MIARLALLSVLLLSTLLATDAVWYYARWDQGYISRQTTCALPNNWCTRDLSEPDVVKYAAALVHSGGQVQTTCVVDTDTSATSYSDFYACESDSVVEVQAILLKVFTSNYDFAFYNNTVPKNKARVDFCERPVGTCEPIDEETCSDTFSWQRNTGAVQCSSCGSDCGFSCAATTPSSVACPHQPNEFVDATHCPENNGWDWCSSPVDRYGFMWGMLADGSCALERGIALDYGQWKVFRGFQRFVYADWVTNGLFCLIRPPQCSTFTKYVNGLATSAVLTQDFLGIQQTVKGQAVSACCDGSGCWTKDHIAGEPTFVDYDYASL